HRLVCRLCSLGSNNGIAFRNDGGEVCLLTIDIAKGDVPELTTLPSSNPGLEVRCNAVVEREGIRFSLVGPLRFGDTCNLVEAGDNCLKFTYGKGDLRLFFVASKEVFNIALLALGPLEEPVYPHLAASLGNFVRRRKI